MAGRWMAAVVVAMTACPAEDEHDRVDDGTTVSSTDGSSTSAPDESATALASSSSGSETSSTSSDTALSAGSAAEWSTTGESGPCLPGDLELVDVVLDVTANRAMGDDVATPYDPDQGSTACVQVTRDEWFLSVDYGPQTFDGLESRLLLRVSAVGEYDLATDVGTPLSGIDGPIELSYHYNFEPAATASYDTQNQAATGIVAVTALPLEVGSTFAFTAQGEIAGSDGWQFDLAFTGTVAATR